MLSQFFTSTAAEQSSSTVNAELSHCLVPEASWGPQHPVNLPELSPAVHRLALPAQRRNTAWHTALSEVLSSSKLHYSPSSTCLTVLGSKDSPDGPQTTDLLGCDIKKTWSCLRWKINLKQAETGQKGSCLYMCIKNLGSAASSALSGKENTRSALAAGWLLETIVCFKSHIPWNFHLHLRRELQKNNFEESLQCQYIVDKTAIQSFNTTRHFGGHKFANQMP